MGSDADEKEKKTEVRVMAKSQMMFHSYFPLWVTTKTVIAVIQLFNPGSSYGCGLVTALLHLTVKEDHTTKMSVLYSEKAFYKFKMITSCHLFNL